MDPITGQQAIFDRLEKSLTGALNRVLSTFDDGEQRLQIPRLKPGTVWDFGRLRSELRNHALMRTYPASTPDTVDLGPLGAKLDQLVAVTARRNIECGRAGFIDLASGTLSLNEACYGSESQVLISLKPPFGRLPHELPNVLLLHTHPARSIFDLHLSTADYFALLSQPSMLISIVAAGESALMVCKTSSTPAKIEAAELARRLEMIREDFLRGRRVSFDMVMNFTKQVAIEYGMSLYVGNFRARNLLEKVRVA